MFGFKKKKSDPDVAPIEARAAAGARLMDSQAPGWHENMNVARLDVASNYNCVLGQTYGSYGVGAMKVFGMFDSARATNARDHGFDANRALTQHEIDREFYLLTKAWRQEIHQRRGQKVSA